VLDIVGLSLPEAMQRLVPALPATTREALVQSYKSAFSHLRATESSSLFPGAAEALHRLSARPGVTLGIATGKSRRGLRHMIDAFALHGLFATVQTADDHPSKPHPAMLLAALSETGCPSDRAVMIGDTTYDIDMARAAGVAAIGVSWGHHAPAALLASGAHSVIDGFDGLDAAVEAALSVRVPA
jgi:phosphoglycolate phosphatase